MNLKLTYQDYEKFAEGNQCMETQRRFILEREDESPNRYNIFKQVGIAYRSRVIRRIFDSMNPKEVVATVYATAYDDCNPKDCIERNTPAFNCLASAWNVKTLDEYEEAIGFKLREFLKDGDNVFDSGSGLLQIADRLSSSLAEYSKTISLSGISLTKAQHVPMNCITYLSFEEVPFNNLELQHLIIDINGVFTFGESEVNGVYSPKTLEILETLCLQLAPGGRLVICTDRHRVGDKFARERLQSYFETNYNLSFEYKLYGDKEEYIRITIDNIEPKLLKKLEFYFNLSVGFSTHHKILWESKEEDLNKRMKIVQPLYVSFSTLEDEYFEENKEFYISYYQYWKGYR